MPAGPAAVVIDAGAGRSRSPLATVRALALAGHPVALATDTPDRWQSLAAASRHVDRIHEIPAASESSFVDAVDAVRLDCDAAVAFACSDDALLRLRPETAALVDKDSLARRAVEAGLRVPEAAAATDVADVAEAADALGYPVVVKPARQRRHAVVANTPADLARVTASADDPVVVQRRLAGPLVAVAAVVADGRAVAASQQEALRTWPVAAGVSCAAVTVPIDEHLLEGIVALVGDLDGLVEVQLLEGRVIDANLRPYGSMSLAVAAGANLPAVWCRVLGGDDVAQVRARPGIRYRWLDADVRALSTQLVHRRRPARETVRDLLPRRGTVHSVWSRRDPRPGVVRLRHMLKGDPA